MIEEWSSGVADDNMSEDMLLELRGLVRRHPWWQARAILTIELLRRHGVNPPASILDAGCGWGVTLEYLEALGYRATGLDISRRALEALDNRERRLVLADLTQDIPAQADRFDAVLALDVIEHIDDDASAVRRLGELIGPKGVLIVSVPALPELFSEFDSIQGHRRRYEPAMLERAFQSSAVTPRQMLWWGESMVRLLRRQRQRPLGRDDESPAAVYRRYLRLPPWPATIALRLLLQYEVRRTLRGRASLGSSLIAVASH
jgi:2-polyprenyl-3-methyl-5-hydroxy-6-metoxy-1,4-benzoquinol methylase